MKIIIVGNGKVGYAIASQLAGEHHDIVMVDDNAAALQRAENALDVMCIEGNGASIRVLKEAGAQSADLVIAVTNLDDTNLLCCFIAKKLGAGHTIARVRSPEYRRDADMLKKEIGLDMVINPDLAAAQEIARIVSTPSAFSVEPFAGGRIDMIGFDVTDQTIVAGRSLSEFSSHTSAKVLFCVAVHGGETVIPNGKYISSPVRIAINSRAFDGVGVFLLPVSIESVTPGLAINESLQTAYLRINGYYTENPFPAYDKSSWSIAGFSTEEAEATTAYPNRGRAVSIIDGENNTYWGTQWRSAKPGPPHWVAVDMGAPKELHGLTIRGRSDKEGSDVPKSSGNPRIFNIDVSDDNQNWTHAGTFTVENRIENTVYLDHKATGRYFRIFVTATQADLYQTCIAEVWAF